MAETSESGHEGGVMARNPCSAEWNAGYLQGYEDGESSMAADFDFALDGLLPDDVDGSAPSQVAEYIRRIKESQDAP